MTIDKRAFTDVKMDSLRNLFEVAILCPKGGAGLVSGGGHAMRIGLFTLPFRFLGLCSL
jgi:hypothetical protein